MVELESTWAILHSVDISNGRQGGIRQVGGWMSLTNVSFSDNTPSKSDFGSVRHNIDCSGNGTVSLHLEEFESKSLWIGGSECSVENGNESLLSPFFVPTLSSKSSCVLTKNKTFSVTIVGSTLIPCGLGLEVFEERVDSGSSSVYSFALTPSTTISFTETTISLELNQTELEKDLNKTFAWSGRLVYGKGAKSSEWFKVKMSGADERKSLAKQAVSIIIPVAASLIALFLLLLVIILVVRHRRKQTKESLISQKELDQVQLDGDGIKFDLFDETNNSLTTDLIQADKMKTFSGLETANEETILKKSMIDESDCRDGSVRDHSLEVAVMKCEGDFTAQTMDRKDTLYERLHGGQKKEMNRKEIVLKVVEALQTVAKHHPNAEALTHLSSHWVLFGKDDVMFIQLKEKKGEEHEPQTVQAQPTTSTDPPPTPIHPIHATSTNANTTSVPSNTTPRESFFRMDEDREGTSLALSETVNDNTTQPSSDSLDNCHQYPHFPPSHFGYIRPVSKPLDALRSPQTQVNKKEGQFEGLRWQSPEVVQKQVSIDKEKAAVFSLGLMMWEIETGLVPFGEMDAVNAARQSEIGVIPRMDLVHDKHLKEVIPVCLSSDPSTRPSLASLLSQLREDKTVRSQHGIYVQ
ncbi:hypothetical protein BLNAU_3073 [Blattamonas nauphoetae]|uniref:Protein kinase domain-containing protein n=1 Tax=Blattamonas nauphoetae TaxID=2049346 RepID=A0ABQ9YE59_9EUKA|nr:hypothetical protein BLNAU_3073 [Blattamonas nauphoetae]